MTIREKEAAALELLVQAAQVEEGRDGSVTVSGWRGVAEGSAHRAVVRVNLVGEVGLFPHLCNRIGIDWIEENSFLLAPLDLARHGDRPGVCRCSTRWSWEREDPWNHSLNNQW